MDALPIGRNPERRVFTEMGYTTGYTYPQFYECMLRWNQGNHRVAHEKAMKIWRKSIPFNPDLGHVLPGEDEDDFDEPPEFPNWSRHHPPPSRRPQQRRAQYDRDRSTSSYGHANTQGNMLEDIQAAINSYYHSDHSRSPHPHHQPYAGRGRRLDEAY